MSLPIEALQSFIEEFDGEVICNLACLNRNWCNKITELLRVDFCNFEKLKTKLFLNRDFSFWIKLYAAYKRSNYLFREILYHLDDDGLEVFKAVYCECKVRKVEPRFVIKENERDQWFFDLPPSYRLSSVLVQNNRVKLLKFIGFIEIVENYGTGKDFLKLRDYCEMSVNVNDMTPNKECLDVLQEIEIDFRQNIRFISTESQENILYVTPYLSKEEVSRIRDFLNLKGEHNLRRKITTLRM